MAYMICKHPAVRIDIMVPQKYWPQLVGVIQNTGCEYFKEDWMELPNGKDYILLRDVKAEKPWQIGNLMKVLSRIETETEDVTEKFYVLIKPRKKGKKHVQKIRQEVYPGSEGGNAGESGDLQSGGTAEAGGSGTEPDIPGADDICQLEMFADGEKVIFDNPDYQ